MGISFLALTQEFFGQSGWIFYGNSSAGDFYLSIGYKKSWLWAFIAIFDLLGPKKERAPTDIHIDMGPQNPTKTLTHLLGQLLSRNCVSNFLDLRASPP